MSERTIVRGPEEGRTLLIAGGDYVTFRVTSAETGGAFFCFESSTLPGFGPPPHAHDYWELFYVLEGSYEFTLQRADRLETFVGGPGTSIAVAPNVPHTFRNAGEQPARMLFVNQPAALQPFFEEIGVPVERAGVAPADLAPPDFAAFGAALERHDVHIVAPG
jgi:quercetin dioxygenase-like cupin family protein